MFKERFGKMRDSLECDYIDMVMLRMNVTLQWRWWIFERLKTRSSSILANES